MPSESEWEYACRAGRESKYCYSKDWDDLGHYAWFFKNDGETGKTLNPVGNKLHPVGTKEPNAWGLYDMVGNVAEFLQDCGHHRYEGAPTDGSAWTAECTGSERMARYGLEQSVPDGVYTDGAALRNMSDRFGIPDTWRYRSGSIRRIGFRVARTS